MSSIKEKLVVIGNGMAGMKAVKELISATPISIEPTTRSARKMGREPPMIDY